MSLTTQFYTMIAMIGMGGWLGAALDTYGRFLKRPRRPHWAVFINDVLFWVLQALVIFYTLLIVNEGELRFYVFLALLCGYAGYQSLLKTQYLKVLDVVIRAIILIYRFLTRTCYLVIFRPIQLLVQFFIVLLLGLWSFITVVFMFLVKVVAGLLKLFFLPIKWVGLLLWKLVPNKSKYYIIMFFKKIAGIVQKVENIKHRIEKLLKKNRKS